jgi:hypothetical protein
MASSEGVPAESGAAADAVLEAVLRSCHSRPMQNIVNAIVQSPVARGRDRWVHDQRESKINKSGNRRDVSEKVEGKRRIERRVDRGGRPKEKQRVPVGRRTSHYLRTDIGATTWLVFDDRRLA